MRYSISVGILVYRQEIACTIFDSIFPQDTREDDLSEGKFNKWVTKWLLVYTICQT